jgi:hypothetical protein
MVRTALMIIGGSLLASGALFGIVYLALCDFVQIAELD